MNAPIDITAHFSMDIASAFVPSLSLSLSPPPPLFLTTPVLAILLPTDTIFFFWKLYRFRATMLPVPKIPIYRLFDSIVRLYFALWLIIRSWKLGWKERLSRRSKHPVTSIRGTIRCPLTEPRISICAHEIDIETFTLATRPDSYNIFSRRGTEADLHLTSRRPDRVATSILASLRNCFLL